MEQRLHQFSVRQCRTFRLSYSRCIKTWWDLRWQRLLASRPSWTKQRGWTSWSSAFVHCSRSNLHLNPLDPESCRAAPQPFLLREKEKAFHTAKSTMSRIKHQTITTRPPVQVNRL